MKFTQNKRVLRRKFDSDRVAYCIVMVILWATLFGLISFIKRAESSECVSLKEVIRQLNEVDLVGFGVPDDYMCVKKVLYVVVDGNGKVVEILAD